MDRSCWICGDPSHQNYDCPDKGKTVSGSTKKQLKKLHRLNHPEEQQRNWKHYQDKKKELAEVLQEEPQPFWFVKMHLDMITDKVLELGEELNSLKCAVDPLELGTTQCHIDSHWCRLQELTHTVRQVSVYAKQILNLANSPRCVPYQPSYLDMDIFSGSLAYMREIHSTISNETDSFGKKFRNNLKNISEILNAHRELETIVRNFEDPQVKIDDSVDGYLKQLDEVEKKIGIAEFITAPAKMELCRTNLRIRNAIRAMIDRQLKLHEQAKINEFLATLQLTTQSPEKILEAIIDAYPPKNVVGNLCKGNQSNMKKRYRYVLALYHPDRQSQFGLKWETICVEITKFLSSKYTSM